jgi:hypothetical protein
MEAIEISGVVNPGKPASVGHLGTLTLEEPNEHGEIPWKFRLNRRFAKKVHGYGRHGILNRGELNDNNASQT